MARGGRRSGSPGRAYGQRTDLNAPKNLPVQAATGQPYGQAGQQQSAQKIVPLRPASSPAPASGGEPPDTAPAAATPAPGTLGAFDRPTERPSEPLTTPAAMPNLPASQQSIVATIHTLAQLSGSPALAQLAQRAGAQQ